MISETRLCCHREARRAVAIPVTEIASPFGLAMTVRQLALLGKDLFGDFFHRLAGAACLTLDLGKCGSFVEPMLAHQDPLGALNQFAGSQRILEAPDVFMQRTDFAKPCQGDFNRRTEGALPHRLYPTGADASSLCPSRVPTVGVVVL